MSANGGEEVEYESDPEEAKRSLAMRRREASDDEEGEGDGYDERPGMDRRPLIHSLESDGEGAGEYYDEDDVEFDSLGDEDGFYDDHEYANDENFRVSVDEGRVAVKVNGERSGASKMVENSNMKVSDEGGRRNPEAEDEKKEVEPFSIPTSGAFYMHDDRFMAMDGSGGRHRRGRGARKLWESKDDRKWGHDKFEELNRKRDYQEGQRTSRGRHRGRGGRLRGTDHELDHGYPRGNRARPVNKNQGQTPKAVGRGRRPGKYERIRKNSREAPTKYKRSWNPVEKTSQAELKTTSARPPNAESASAPSQKQISASSLSHASPPFYPSGSTGNLTPKEDVQAGSMNRNLLVSQGSVSLKGKNVIDSIDLDKLYIDDVSSRSLVHVQMPSTGSSSMKLHAVKRGSTQSWVQQSFKTANQHFVSGSIGSSVTNDKLEPDSDQSEPSGGTLLANGKGVHQANGTGSSFLYGGTQCRGASGNMAAGQVMQFGGQRSSGVGLQTVGMAFPGYVASPQSGIASSEMTWLPVLAGAGAFGSTYCPPYLTADGSYHTVASVQPSSASSSSKVNNANISKNEWKPGQKPEVANNEFATQQSNPNRQPRRYSEMSFSK